MASGVVGAIEPEIHLAEIARATRKPTNNLVAYDLYLRALFHKLTRESLSETLRLLRRALELDPAYAPAASLVGWCRSLQGVQGWLTRSHSGIAESIALARQAIESGKNDPVALWMAGYTLSFFAGEHALAAKVIERALSLNPNCAHAWMAMGYVHFFVNEAALSADAQYRAIRLSPLDPIGYIFKLGLAFAHFAGGEYDAAMTWIDRSLGEQPRLASAIRVKAALCALLGRIEEANKRGDRLLALDPDFTISGFVSALKVCNSPVVMEVYEKGLPHSGSARRLKVMR